MPGPGCVDLIPLSVINRLQFFFFNRGTLHAFLRPITPFRRRSFYFGFILCVRALHFEPIHIDAHV
jgi:hypothetical protein